MTRIYLDVCCLNRPFDDQEQSRVRLESEAVLLILAQCKRGRWEWIGSEILTLEVRKTPDPERRRRVFLSMANVQQVIMVDQPEIIRAQQLRDFGFSAVDALHLACAESGQVDVLLTTDDLLLRKATKYAKQLHVLVKNPLKWLAEVREK